MRPFSAGIFLKYSQLEHVNHADQVRHPIIREALKLTGLETPQIEIHDAGRHSIRHGTWFLREFHDAQHAPEGAVCAPAGTSAPQRTRQPNSACQIEIDFALASRLGSRISTSPRVAASPASRFTRTGGSRQSHSISPSIQCSILKHNLLLFFTGFSRSAGSILADQHTGRRVTTLICSATCITSRDLGLRSRAALEASRRYVNVRLADARALGAQKSAAPPR